MLEYRSDEFREIIELVDTASHFSPKTWLEVEYEQQGITHDAMTIEQQMRIESDKAMHEEWIRYAPQRKILELIEKLLGGTAPYSKAQQKANNKRTKRIHGGN